MTLLDLLAASWSHHFMIFSRSLILTSDIHTHCSLWLDCQKWTSKNAAWSIGLNIFQVIFLHGDKSFVKTLIIYQFTCLYRVPDWLTLDTQSFRLGGGSFAFDRPNNRFIFVVFKVGTTRKLPSTVNEWVRKWLPLFICCHVIWVYDCRKHVRIAVKVNKGAWL